MSSYLAHKRKGFQGAAPLAFDGFGNRSRSLDGSSDYISIPDINESTTNLSVALWLKTTDQDWVTTHLAHWKNTDNNRAWYIGPSRTAETNGKKLMVFITENGAGTTPVKRYYGTTDVSDGTWHHVAFTWDNGTLKLFVDGSEETTTKVLDNAMTTIHNSNGPITVGCTWVNNAPANFGSGGKADVRIYNSTLTDADISDIYNGTNITTNLVGHWLTDADNVLDAAGTNHGTNYGSKYSYDNPSPPVEFGSASRSFDGTSDYISIADNADIPTGAQTICCWVKFNTLNSGASGQDLITHWTTADSNNASFAIYMSNASNGKVRFYISEGGQLNVNVEALDAISALEWSHVACVFTPNDSIKIYINGSLSNTLATTGISSLYNSSVDLVLGGRDQVSVTTLLNGKLADFRFYDTDLTASQISDLYNGTNITTNLVGHWLTDNDDVEDKAGTNDGTNFGSAYSYDNPPMDLVPSRQASRSFDGTSDYVNLGDVLNSKLTGSTPTWTISTWLKTDSLDDGLFISKINANTNNRQLYFRVLSTGEVAGLVYEGGTTSANRYGRQTATGGSITANAWHHVAVSWDYNSTGSYLRIWIDGAEATTLTDYFSNGISDGTIFSGNADVLFGTTDGTAVAHWGGKIADMRIYDTHLTASQILAIYNGTTDRTNLVGQWLTNSDDVLDHAGTNDGTNNGSTYSTDSPS